MATAKETIDGCEKKEEDANLVEVEEKGVKEDPEEVGEKAEGPGGNEEAEEKEVEEEELKEDWEDEEVREEHEEEEAEVEGKGEDVDEDDDGKKIDGEESEKKSEISKKRTRKQRKGELESPRTPGSERPTRERKMVERFMVGETPKASASKTLSIEKGQGTQLKDIPNVAFKLSKRKADENLQLLHSILFGKKSKVHTLKKNIGLFSGFVWVENEEKQRAKLKEKIEKCVKEKLLDFCDVLNIPVNKATTKKEQLSAKLLDFLESPHATTDSLLADKDKGKKRKGKASTGKSPSSSNATAGKSKKVEKVHKWLFKEEEDMTWETYRYCCNWNTIERSILMKTIHNFAKANRPKDYWKVRTWMNLSDTYNEMAVRRNQIKRSYHEIIGGGKYLQSLFTIERQRHFHENTPVDQILLDIFEPCNECRNRIPVFPKSLLYNGSNPSTSFGSRTDSSSHSKKQWTPDELELLKSTISDFSSASVPKPYWDVQLWTDLSETYNVQARFKNLNTVSYLEFISGGMQLQSIFCEERLSNALHGFGSRGRDFVLMKIFEPCLECRKRIPVFPNGLPNNGSTSSASSSARSVQSHFTSYEDESYSATLNNMLIVVREMFEKGLLTSAQLSIVTLKLHDFAQTETWKVCLLNNIFTLEMKREVLIQSISPEA